jgi:hypothetical protein
MEEKLKVEAESRNTGQSLGPEGKELQGVRDLPGAGFAQTPGMVPTEPEHRMLSSDLQWPRPRA